MTKATSLLIRVLFCCCAMGLAMAPAQAGWKEANAALQKGDNAAALRQIRPLAEAGDAAAQYMLGYLLSTADGIEHDLTEAFKWYTIALARGQRAAAGARALIGRKLGNFKAAEAQRQAMQWLNEHRETATPQAPTPKSKQPRK